MKRNIIVLVVMGLTAAVAFGTPALERLTKIFGSGVFVVRSVSEASTSANKLTATYGGTKDYDFPATTDTCEDSTTFTVTGAKVGDTCTLGLKEPINHNDAGVAGFYDCRVTAADTVKITMCSHGAFNPADAGFNIRVFSNQ